MMRTFSHGLLLLALTQPIGIQGIEIDRLQQERREPAGLNQFGNELARIGIEHVRTLGAKKRIDHIGLESGQTEQPGLLDLGHVHGIAFTLAKGAGQGDREHHFIGAVTQTLNALGEIHVQLRRILLVENLRGLGRLKGDVLDIDFFDTELRTVDRGRRGGSAIALGLFRHQMSHSR